MDFYKNGTFFSIERHVGNVTALDEHFHSLYEFYYLKSGTATYLVNDKIYHLKKGDIVVIPPNTLHKTISSCQAERERILFYLDPRYFSSMIAIEDLLPALPLLCHADTDLRLCDIFEELLREFSAKNEHLYSEVLICELLILLKRHAKGGLAESRHTETEATIPRVLSYIAANYSRELTLKETAKLFYVNPSYLSRSFKAHTGFTFCSYLNNYRIQEANKLLSETDKKITEIALSCGFNSLNNFCKCYKKIMKTPPLAYKKRMAKR